LALHQQAADEVGGHLFCGAGEEGLGEVWGKRGGDGSGLGDGAFLDWSKAVGAEWASPRGVAVASQAPNQQHPRNNK
jgi:hypothetical protein